MQIRNCHYFNTYSFFRKLWSLVICCFLFACSGQNKSKQVLLIENQTQVSESAINVNTASAAELERLPHVGEKLAREIIEHREKFGRFRKPEHILFVRRVSDRRFREIRHLIRVE